MPEQREYTLGEVLSGVMNQPAATEYSMQDILAGKHVQDRRITPPAMPKPIPLGLRNAAQPVESDFSLIPDANTPMNMLRGAGRGLANLAGALTLPFTPNPFVTLGTNMSQSAAEQAALAASAPTTSEKIGHYAAAAIPFVGPWAAGLGERAGSGDIAGALTEGAVTVAGPKAGEMIVKRMVKGDVQPLPGQTARNLPQPGPGTQSLLDAVDAGRKLSNADRLQPIVDRAKYDLKTAEQEYLGRPVAGLKDAAAVTKYAKEQAWTPYQQLLDQTKELVPREKIVAQAIDNLPDSWDTGSSLYKRAVAKIRNAFTEDSYSVNEIEQKAQDLNAELRAHYKKNNLDRAASSKLPTTAPREALLAAYRALQDSTVQRQTGYDPAPLRSRYGDLAAIESALIDRPVDQKGIYDILTRPGYAPTTRSVGGRIVETMLQRTPDDLAAKAFRQFPSKNPPLNQPLPTIAPNQ